MKGLASRYSCTLALLYGPNRGKKLRNLELFLGLGDAESGLTADSWVDGRRVHHAHVQVGRSPNLAMLTVIDLSNDLIRHNVQSQ